MGERTAILLKKNFGHNRSTITLIHHQWGIGKVMPSLFIQEVLKVAYPLDRSLEYFHKGTLKQENKLPIDYFFTFEPLSNVSCNYVTNKEVKTNDPQEDIWKPEVRMRYGDMTDNNHGLMLVEVTQNFDKYGEPENFGFNMFSIKLGFVLGHATTSYCHDHLRDSIKLEPEFFRLVSMEEFVCRTFRYKEESVQRGSRAYVRACRKIMKLLDVKEVYDKEGKKGREDLESHIACCVETLTKDLPEGTLIDIPLELQQVPQFYK